MAAALLLACAAGLLLPTRLPAQERVSLESLDQRLQRVERVVDSSLLNLAQKVGEAQNEIRELRGEIESLRNDLQQLDRRNRDFYQDTDKRLTGLEERPPAPLLSPGAGADGAPRGSSPLIAPDGRSGSSPDGDRAAADGAPGNAPVIVAEQGARDPAAGNVSADGRPQPPDSPVTDGASRVATAAEQQGYREAYDLLASGYNEEAVAAFDRFLTDYPTGPYSDNAWYWQGEALYARRDFDGAIRNFTVVADYFLDSPKVPDARLKIGFALFEQQKFAAARAILTEVQDDYPGRSASVLARRRLQDMDEENR